MAIEFLGPVAVAVLGSRRVRDLVAVLLAVVGVVLVAGVQLGVDPAGVGFALLAAALWAGYILVGKRVADAGAGLDSLAVGMAVAAVVLAAPLLFGQLARDASVFADPRVWALGAAVGVLSTAVPYGLDQVVLRRMGRARFALLLALLPATAAVVGAVALAQRPTIAEVAGIALVMAALVVSAERGDTVGSDGELGDATMPVDRLLPSDEAAELIALTRDVADKLLDPIVDEHERTETYPDGVFAQLGAAGLLSLPQPEEWGGGGQPYEVYLQVLEEIAARWAAVAVAVSVHSLSSHPLLTFGTDEQKQRWLPDMLSGNRIGAYSLSEPQAGSDAAALRCAAVPADGGYVAERDQVVDHPRWRRGLLHAVRADRRRVEGHFVLPGAR